MANNLYALAVEKLLTGALDLTDGNLTAVLVDGDDYTPNLDTDEFLDDIAGAALVGTPVAIGTPVVSGRVLDGDNVTFTSVSGDEAEYLVLFSDTSNAATSPLVAIFDSATGLPVTPNGNDITTTWHGSGILAIPANT